MNSTRGRGWIAANVFVVALTALCLLLSITKASGDLAGGLLIVILLLWLVYDLWLRYYGGHPTERQWPNALISLGAAFGVPYTAVSATHLAIDLQGTSENTTPDGLSTMIGVVILAAAAMVELYRRERDRNRPPAVTD